MSRPIYDSERSLREARGNYRRSVGDYGDRTVAELDRSIRRDHFPDPAEATTADALSESAAVIAKIINARAMVCYTSSGSTARRIARERPPVPIMVMTASLKVARRLGLQWGVHAVHTRDVTSFEEMVGKAKRMALRNGIVHAGERMVVMAGVPFARSGSTNVLHVVKLEGDELERRDS